MHDAEPVGGRMASSMSWVMKKIVHGCAARSGSAPPAGRAGLGVERRERLVHQQDRAVATSARAIWMRCFMPPESSAGNLCSWPVSPTSSMYDRPLPPLGAPRAVDAQPEVDVVEGRQPRIKRIVALEITIRSRPGPVTSWPSTATCPRLLASKPASRLSAVVLPQPEGPSSRWNSPLGIARSKPWMIQGPSSAGANRRAGAAGESEVSFLNRSVAN